jgi:type II secretory pathway component GspD/PulD (secretin)
MKYPTIPMLSITTASLLIAVVLPGAVVSCTSSAALHTEPVLADSIPQRRDVEEARALRNRNPIDEDLEVSETSGPAIDEEEILSEAVPLRPSIGDGLLRQLDLRGTPLSEAVHLIAAMGGVNIYLDANLSQPVDASFPAVTLDDALGVLLDRNGLTLVEDPPGLFWVIRNDGSQESTATFRLQSVNGADVVENLSALVGSGTALIVDAAQNLVVVRGTQRDVDAVEDYLAVADCLKKQVLIEVEILEIGLADEFEFGIAHIFSEPNFLGETGLGLVSDLSTAADTFQATLDFHDFSLETAINALSSYGAVKVLSSPRVMAITNTVANIEVITEVPYVEVTTAIDSGGGTTGTTSSQESVSFKEAGIKLEVTPIVQEGGVIQLSVNQEFSEIVDYFLGIPVLDSRKVITQFLVNGRQTVVIGGLMQDRVSESDRGVPVLMHIPFLGRLFRSDQDKIERRELLVLITPRVLDPGEAAALAGRYEQRFEDRSRALGIDDQR